MNRVLEKEGKKVVFLGNEAIVRGALESGVAVASCYPGTPASEVGDTFFKIAKDLGMYFEYSINEKLALETGAMAAFCGLKSIVSMKHFGLNVASDSFLPVVYSGVKGAMVLNVADDPGCLSSGQSEQDSRFYARMAHCPVIEPSDVQECKDLTKFAFELSSKYKIPIILRTTTRVAHGRGVVTLGKMNVEKPNADFKRDTRFIVMPPTVLEEHKEVSLKLDSIRKEVAEKSPVNFEIKGSGKIGIVTSGVSYGYVMEALQELGLKIPVLKLGITYPLAEEKVMKFSSKLDEVLVVEELEGVLEKDIKALGLKAKVYGKDLVNEVGELNTKEVIFSICKLLKNKCDFDFSDHEKKIKSLGILNRDPILCQGCPHRATYWIMKQVYGNDAIYGGDIGCYLLASHKPIAQADYIICMGGGMGLSHGLKKVSKQKVVNFIGDGTFLHVGMPALANMVYNKSNPLVVILDNRITAMTGHQPRAGVGLTGMQEQSKPIILEDIAKSLGVDNVEVINPLRIKESIEKVKKLKEKDELAVVVSREPCRLIWLRDRLKKGEKFVRYEIDQSKCIKCGTCLLKFGCPAIKRENNTYEITDMCWGCSACAQVCPANAIHAKR